MLTFSPRLKPGDSHAHGLGFLLRGAVPTRRPFGLHIGLIGPRKAMTERPSAKILQVALMSRSWVVRHCGQVHVRTESGRACSTWPQSAQRLLGGQQRSMCRTVEFVKYLNEDKSTLHGPTSFSGRSEDIGVDIGLQYTDGYTETFATFVNCIPTKSGGTHVRGFKTAFTRVFNDYARTNGFIKEGQENFEGDLLREGLTCVLSIRISNPEFIGQTKDELSNKEAQNIVGSIVSEQLSAYLDQNRGVADSIIQRAILSKRAREAAKKAADDVRTGNDRKDKKGRRKVLVEKLTAPNGKDYPKNELFIVEGDSAGGSAKQGRDSQYQGILPLRGKSLNVERENDLTKSLKNAEIAAIVDSIGAGIGASFDLSQARYGKVIIMSDADPDGGHIQSLLITLFYQFMRPLVDAGMLFVAMPPPPQDYIPAGKRKVEATGSPVRLE